jgi:cell division septation protein DedD
MSYDFSFDKTMFGALLAGSIVLGVLLFVAGVLVGGNLGANAKTEQARSGKTADDALAADGSVVESGARQTPVAGEPVMLREPLGPGLAEYPVNAQVPAAPGLAAPGAGGQGMAAQGMAAQGMTGQGMTGQGLGASVADVPKAPSAAAPPAASFKDETPRWSQPIRDPDPRLVQEAETGVPGGGDADATGAAKALAYSVQVGAFQEEKSARRLVAELEDKGYSPSLFTGQDAESRLWYSVRIGAYAEVKEASQAAANFTKQEKLKASVRPINSF